MQNHDVVLQAVKDHLSTAKGRLRPFRSVSLRLSTGDETVVAPALERLSTQFEGSVGIGSYPVRRKHSQRADCLRHAPRESPAEAGAGHQSGHGLSGCSNTQSSCGLMLGASTHNHDIGHGVT